MWFYEFLQSINFWNVAIIILLIAIWWQLVRIKDYIEVELGRQKAVRKKKYDKLQAEKKELSENDEK